MIEFLHFAPWLYQFDAYRDYCYFVDFGGYQPASFIDLCSESFATFCAETGIHMLPLKEEGNSNLQRAQELDGLVIRITSQKDLALIQRYLDLNRNVLLLLPNMWATLGGGKDVIFAEAANVLSTLNTMEFANRLGQDMYSKDIWWNEISQQSGRLFVAVDHFISDAFFKNGYGKSPENTNKLAQLRRELGTFRCKFLTIGLRNPVRAWPCHAPIALIFEIQNRGVSLSETDLTINLPSNFEPLGAPEFKLPNMAPLSKTSVTLQAIPRFDGNYPTFFTASSTDSDLRIKVASPDLSIIPSNPAQLRRQSYKDSSDLEHLNRVVSFGTELLDHKTLNVLEELAAIEPAVCLQKIRLVAERIAQKISKNLSLKFIDQIRLINEYNLLSQKSVGYLHTIRVLGNLASHPSEETITGDDVRIVAFALSSVLEEALDKDLTC